jgi:hypothetical protein
VDRTTDRSTDQLIVRYYIAAAQLAWEETPEDTAAAGAHEARLNEQT